MSGPELSADDTAILWTAPGRRHDLVLASYFKRVVVGEGLTADARLFFLEGLSRMLTPAALARIVPADDVSMQIIEEAMGLDRGSDGFERSFGVLTGDEVFRTLLTLNPSLMGAVRALHGAGVMGRPEPEPSSRAGPGSVMDIDSDD
jgi:hypothetical protein